ncbi:MAG: GntR family transcriptional regulator [Pseudomonadota bacterium]
MTPAPPDIPAHEHVYRGLRQRIMYGELAPGAALTLRGVAGDYETSMTPAREAMRRLVAEGALTISQTGRLSTPELGIERIEELASIRAMLEAEMAARAMPRAHISLIERLGRINSEVEEAVVKGDPVSYIKRNLEFHRALYLRAQAPSMLALVEVVWLQLGPTMRTLYEKRQRKGVSQNHLLILAALKAGDEPSLRLAVRQDVTQGLRMLVGGEAT